MIIDSTKIDAFAVLAQTLNYSSAAKHLNISQPALTKKIAKLEDELGTTLFIRSKRKVELTAAGHELVAYAKAKDEIDQKFLSRIGIVNENSSSIKIASFSTITSSCLIPTLKPIYTKDHQLNFEFITRETRDLPSLLLNGATDIILHDEEIIRENVICELIGKETLLHVVPKEGDKHLPYLDHDINDKITLNYLKEQGQRANIQRIFVDDIHSILSGVASGLGQAVISRHLFNSKTMREIKSRKKVYSPIYLCYLNRPYMPKLLQDTIECLKSDLKNYL